MPVDNFADDYAAGNGDASGDAGWSNGSAAVAPAAAASSGGW